MITFTEKGAEKVQEFLASPQHPDAGRTNDLVARESYQVRSERSHVDCQLRNRLRRIHHHGGTDRMTQSRDLADRVDGPEHIRNVGHGDDLGSLV